MQAFGARVEITLIFIFMKPQLSLPSYVSYEVKDEKRQKDAISKLQ